MKDHSTSEFSAIKFFDLTGSRDPYSQAARLSDQFESQNRSLFSRLGVEVNTTFNGKDVGLRLSAGSTIGAVPLISPTRGTPDYGLVIQPRFSWRGIGPMLSDMGWRITPTPLRLPLLRRSERRVPPWVLSSMILMRLDALLKSLQRRFEIVSEHRIAPRGSVRWAEYATSSVSRGNLLSVPCVYPDLRDDASLKGAIRFTLERQLRSLQTQLQHGAHVHKLIELCNLLLRAVAGVPSIVPSSMNMKRWVRVPLRNEVFRDGLQAIEWTAEDRGLAGLSDLDGIPWEMPMDSFFEAFVETVLQGVSRRIGAQLRSGRNRETVHPIAWEPTLTNSQKALIPDFTMEWGNTTFIIDAKYKRHFEELEMRSWTESDQVAREQHRIDLFQALAYANLSRKPRVVTCLAYPCERPLWDDLCRRGRLFHKSDVVAGDRSVSVWLTAMPMGASLETVVSRFEQECRVAVGTLDGSHVYRGS